MRRHIHIAIKESIRFRKRFKDLGNEYGFVSKRILGDVGELYVIQKLKELGYNFEPRGGHCGCDILLTDQNKKIEVRTSLLKNDGLYPRGILFYGWRILSEGGRRDKFDYLICVAMDDHYKAPKFYVFTSQEAMSVENVRIPRYTRIRKKINIFPSLRVLRLAVKAEPSLVTKKERYFNLNKRKYLNKWSKLKG